MGDAWIGFIGVVVGSLISLSSTVGVEWWRDRRDASRKAEEQRRATIIELQDALVRLSGFFFDYANLREDRKPFHAPWVGMMQTIGQLYALWSRLEDLKIQWELGNLANITLLADEVNFRNKPQSNRYIRAFTESYNRSQALLGDALRQKSQAPGEDGVSGDEPLATTTG